MQSSYNIQYEVKSSVFAVLRVTTTVALQCYLYIVTPPDRVMLTNACFKSISDGVGMDIGTWSLTNTYIV